ncbi:ADP-ribosylglycohydrolase [Serinibacter arcticus]|uniref:ADP-ribosylglycohydrolase n=1 Tax=Serinibacter arcticus TaxID=1655435 RepID=A0A4Z1DZP8_9MICO|nr:ADP-ribosylglycohydrolase [Serinibacter arcticus]
MTLTLTADQEDRAVAALLGSALGDALGAGYEFAAVAPDLEPGMIGGGLGNFAPGEWTDDTAQAVAVARGAVAGDLRTERALDVVAAGFARWFAEGPADVGIQTRAVLQLAGPDASAARMREAAAAVHARTGRSAGNGALMRTAPVALAHLDDPEALVQAALAVAALTHVEADAGSPARCGACWSGTRCWRGRRRCSTTSPRGSRGPTCGGRGCVRPRRPRRRPSRRTPGPWGRCRRRGPRSCRRRCRWPRRRTTSWRR